MECASTIKVLGFFFSFHISIWRSQENPPHQGKSIPDRQTVDWERSTENDHFHLATEKTFKGVKGF